MGLTTTNASLYIGVPLFTIAIALVVFAFKILSKVKSENKLPRWNAFQLPWDQWQVLATSWIIFSSFVFYGVTIPTIPSSGGASTALYALQGVPYSMMLLTWLYLSFAEVSINRTTDNQWGNPKGEMYHCQQCNAYFDGLKRKHCQQCQKYVRVRDQLRPPLLLPQHVHQQLQLLWVLRLSCLFQLRDAGGDRHNPCGTHRVPHRRFHCIIPCCFLPWGCSLLHLRLRVPPCCTPLGLWLDCTAGTTLLSVHQWHDNPRISRFKVPNIRVRALLRASNQE